MTTNHNDFLDAADDALESERAAFEQVEQEPVAFDQWGNPIQATDEPEDDEPDYDDEPWDGFMTDAEADGDALASAGWGTDEDYGYASEVY